MTSATAQGPEPPRRSSGSVMLGVLLLAFGTLISIVGAATLAAGLVAAGVNQVRDAEGYFATPTENFTTQSYALTSPNIGRLTTARAMPNLPFDLATIRLRATSADSDIFIGIAPRADVSRYLHDVKRTEITSARYFPFRVGYRDIAGTRAPQPPAESDIWVQSATGPGAQELQWKLEPGDWGIVVMNADGSAGVTAQLQAAVRSDLIAPAATSLIVLGVILLVLGLPMLIVGAVILGRRIPPTAPAVVPEAPTAAAGVVSAAGTVSGGGGVFPAHLWGVRDANLSRWLWLVKWILAIPHYFLLVFLAFAFALTTVIAGFAILFTGRYPRSLFTFNVGVLRWSWRVGFYSYSALGTDKYPPFTLARTDYPADFDIEYPQRLNRGLVLVKWWLLAIPHYLLLAAISGPVLLWRWGEGADRAGLSLVGVLVLIAGIALLFTAKFPGGIFNLVVGINRWIYRVISYAALFRDEYPPFRLDQGPLEPVSGD